MAKNVILENMKKLMGDFESEWFRLFPEFSHWYEMSYDTSHVDYSPSIFNRFYLLSAYWWLRGAHGEEACLDASWRSVEAISWSAGYVYYMALNPGEVSKG